MTEAEDYESLPPSTPLFVSATAGAFAGIAEHCAMFPVDCVKTRLQSLSCDKQRAMSVRQMLSTMVREEGLFRPLRGMNAMACGAGPAHAMYFTCLELGREAAVKTGASVHLADGVAAVFATLCHDAVMTPADLVKQRMQMCCSPYSGCVDCVRCVIRNEGPRALFRAYPTQLMMSVPFQASVVVSYSFAQRFFNPNKRYNPWAHFASGALSGAVASAITMPLDVCKTLLNTQEAGVLKTFAKTEINGLAAAAVIVHGMRGWRGFFSGLGARILYQAPSTAVAWSVYEFFKFYLMKTGQLSGGTEGQDDFSSVEGYGVNVSREMKTWEGSLPSLSAFSSYDSGSNSFSYEGQMSMLHPVKQESVSSTVASVINNIHSAPLPYQRPSHHSHVFASDD